MSKKLSWALLFTLLGSVAFTGCTDEDPQDKNSSINQSDNNENTNDDSSQSISNETYYANMFGKDILETYYLWNEEIHDDLNQWNIETNNDPIGTFSRIRYHEGEKYIDKWSMLTNDMTSLTNNMNGTTTSFGWNLSFYDMSDIVSREQYIGVVNFVYKDSPAAKAGLKRGDILLTLDGNIINSSNYQNLYYSNTLTVTLGLLEPESYTIHDQNKEVSLTAVSMYENPIICDSIYEFNGKKVGYLAYTSFDFASIPQLIEISRKFKAEQVKELILDLRYNGGGYVTTEQVLASVFAPQSAVTNKEVFEKEVYNKTLTQYYQEEGINLESRFETDFEYQNQGQTVKVNTKDANIGLEKIYGLISSGSASASEALLGGLMPYTQIELIGSQSHGKYCTGIIVPAKEFYVKPPAELDNWGTYVMISIYQNALGETPCMPDGLTPDIAVKDNPLLPYAIGDVNEPLLKQALIEAGLTYDESTISTTLSRSMVSRLRKLPQTENGTFGKRILTLPSKVAHDMLIKAGAQ
ncbi:S41 family peptidase [uncultured Bacteroides sp.]|uniref:S41 family peptidase n=1 Tax=uncultured Bacteroides sp. TaxID=162156 RepID=UPI00260DF2DA|nr:S41 family peptidase [uncultured Bacteroides sp.]